MSNEVPDNAMVQTGQVSLWSIAQSAHEALLPGRTLSQCPCEVSGSSSQWNVHRLIRLYKLITVTAFIMLCDDSDSVLSPEMEGVRAMPMEGSRAPAASGMPTRL